AEVARVAGLEQDGQRALEPGTRAETRREQRLGVLGDVDPAVPAGPLALERRQPVRCAGPGYLAERREDGDDVTVAPRRRPARATEILEDEQHHAVVVPADHLRHEGRADGVVYAPLVPQRPRPAVVERDPRERAPPVRELDAPVALVRPVAAALDRLPPDSLHAGCERDLSRREALAQAGCGCRPDRRRR